MLPRIVRSDDWVAQEVEKGWPLFKEGTSALGRYDIQEEFDHMELFTDADWAGCRRNRKSTSGGIAIIGGHCIKAWAKVQSIMARSSAESELYSVVRGACEGLGLITLNKDLGEVMGVRLNLDVTAAKGIPERQGTSHRRERTLAPAAGCQQARAAHQGRRFRQLLRLDDQTFDDDPTIKTC